MKLALGYSDSEDRIWLRAENSDAIWWLTRRIALGLARQWAELVERSYLAEGGQDAAAAAAGGARAAAAEAAHGGHAAAVASAATVDPIERPAAGTEMVNRVVSSIDLSMSGTRFRIVLNAAGKQHALQMTRPEAHRMLAALSARCRRSGWLEVRLQPWLAAERRSAAADESGGSGSAPA